LDELKEDYGLKKYDRREAREMRRKAKDEIKRKRKEGSPV